MSVMPLDFGFLYGIFDYLMAIIILAIFGGVIYAVFKLDILKPYNIKVIVLEDRVGNRFIRFWKARRVTKKNGEHYFQFSGKEFVKIKPEIFEKVIIDNKGHSNLLLYSPAPNSFFPMILDTTNDLNKDTFANLKIIDAEVSFWKNLVDKEALTKWREKSFMEKFMPMIAMGMMVMLSIILIYGVMNYGIIPLIEKGQAVNTECVSQCFTRLDQITQQLHGTTINPITPPH